MSPEQVLGEKEIDHRSDIYSAGVLLYEMLTGILPYNLDTESLFKIQNRILQEPLPDPREAYPHISDSTVALLMSFTQKEREDRPGEILVALDKEQVKEENDDKGSEKAIEKKKAQELITEDASRSKPKKSNPGLDNKVAENKQKLKKHNRLLCKSFSYGYDNVWGRLLCLL
jgi:serine/threonine protein kinase